MDIEKILEYQALDVIINKADQEFANSEESKKYQSLRALVKNYQEQILKLENETGEIYKELDKKSVSVTDMTKEIKSGTRGLSPKNLEQAVKNDALLTALENKQSSLEKEVVQLLKRLAEIAEMAKKRLEALSKAKADLKIAKEVLDKKRNAILANISQEGIRRNQLKQSIPKEDMALYEQKRKDGIRLPYVVEFKDGSCRGCGMHVQTEMQGKLSKSGDVAECPNCRRILYRK